MANEIKVNTFAIIITILQWYILFTTFIVEHKLEIQGASSNSLNAKYQGCHSVYTSWTRLRSRGIGTVHS